MIVGSGQWLNPSLFAAFSSIISNRIAYDSPHRSLHCWRSALMELTSTSISNMTMTSRPPDVIMTSHRARDTMTLIMRHHRSNGDWSFTSHGRVFTSERSAALTRRLVIDCRVKASNDATDQRSSALQCRDSCGETASARATHVYYSWSVECYSIPTRTNAAMKLAKPVVPMVGP